MFPLSLDSPNPLGPPQARGDGKIVPYISEWRGGNGGYPRNMRLAAIALAGLASAGAAAAGAGPKPASVTLSSTRAGARPVAMTVAWQTELQCGRLLSRKVELRFPASERLPSSVATSSVRVGGLHPASVTVSAHTLTIMLPRPSGLQCYTLATGTARIVLGRAAHLGNPSRAGTYGIVVRDRTGVAFARETIRA